MQQAECFDGFPVSFTGINPERVCSNCKDYKRRPYQGHCTHNEKNSFKGIYNTNVGSVLLLGKSDTTILIPHNSIERLAVSSGRRRSVGRGLLIGFGTGVIAGSIVGGISYNECVPEGIADCMLQPTSSEEAFLMGGILGGVLGIVTGTVTGFLIKRDQWTKVPVEALYVSTSSHPEKVILHPLISLRLSLTGYN